MSTSIEPYGNANSFSGVPWTVPNPTYNGNVYGIGGAIGSLAGESAPVSFGNPTMTNPQAAGYAGQIEGIAGQLGAAGQGAIGAANATKGQVGGLASQLQGLGTGLRQRLAGTCPMHSRPSRQRSTRCSPPITTTSIRTRTRRRRLPHSQGSRVHLTQQKYRTQAQEPSRTLGRRRR